MIMRSPSPMVLKCFLVLFAISILLVGRILWPFLSILVLSFLLTGLFQPIYRFINKKFSSSFSSLVTCVIIVVLVFVPLSFFVGALSKEALALYQSAKGVDIGLKLKELIQESAFMIKLQGMLESFGVELEPEGLNETLSDFVRFAGLFLYNQASAWAANIMHFLFAFFMMIITIFFLLIDHERLINFIIRLSPLPEEHGRRLIGKFQEIAGAVLIGNGICGLIQGILGGLVFSLLHLGSPLIWGGMMGILAFLPIFGVGLVLLPASLVLLLKGQALAGIGLAIFYILLSFSVEYALKPKLVGKRLKMHTLLVFLAIMGGLSVFGVLGIIYGPLIITAFLTLTEIYFEHYDAYVKSREDVHEA